VCLLQLQGLKFLTFPYLLTMQLKRFDFDYTTMHRIKLNDRSASKLVCSAFSSITTGIYLDISRVLSSLRRWVIVLSSAECSCRRLGLDRYRAGVRYPILSPQLYRYRYRAVQIFCTEKAILCGVQVCAYLCFGNAPIYLPIYCNCYCSCHCCVVKE